MQTNAFPSKDEKGQWSSLNIEYCILSTTEELPNFKVGEFGKSNFLTS